jgi:hypothetical protein
MGKGRYSVDDMECGTGSGKESGLDGAYGAGDPPRMGRCGGHRAIAGVPDVPEIKADVEVKHYCDYEYVSEHRHD